MAIRNTQCRWWCVTFNVPEGETFEEWDPVLIPLLSMSTIAYAVFNHEIAPTSGQLHYQGVIRFKKAWRFNRVQTLLPPGCHIERCRCGNDIFDEEMFAYQDSFWIACDGVDKAMELAHFKDE